MGLFVFLFVLVFVVIFGVLYLANRWLKQKLHEANKEAVIRIAEARTDTIIEVTRLLSEVSPDSVKSPEDLKELVSKLSTAHQSGTLLDRTK